MTAPPNLECLSNAPLDGKTPLALRFRELDCHDFHDSCRWLHRLPYGRNSRQGDIEALFQDRRGTCVNKHGVAAALAAELNLPVFKYVVFYKLDESIRPGSKAVLSSLDLEYIPATHCILGEAGKFVDLTWDNQTGKLKNLTNFDIYAKTKPMLSSDEHEALRAWGLMEYQRTESKLRQFDQAAIAGLIDAIVEESKPCSCE